MKLKEVLTKTRMRYHVENVEEEYMSVKQIANFTKEDSKNETIERS